MEIRFIEKYGREFVVYENGEVYRLPFFSEHKKIKRKRFPFKKVSGKLTRPDGYDMVQFTSNGKHRQILTQRIVAEAFLDDFAESLCVDHINGKRFDNRVCNLRMLTQAENNAAFKKKIDGTSSKYRGVSFMKSYGKYEAYITVNGKRRRLGYFDCEKEAAIAFNVASVKFGRLPEALNII